MLAGIGGRTVAEAQGNISWNEFQAWMKYRELHGSLTVHGTLEHGFAMVAHMVSCSIPRKRGARAPKFEDFLPNRAAQDQGSMDFDAARRMWQGATGEGAAGARRSRRRR